MSHFSPFLPKRKIRRKKIAIPKDHTPRPKQKKFVLFVVLLSCVALGCGGYLWFIFGQMPFIVNLRTLYIETALTTADHQWLATYIIPHDTVKVVVDSKITSSTSGGLEYLLAANRPKWLLDSGAVKSETATAQNADDDILGQKSLKVGDTDYAGYKIQVNDYAEGIIISEITGNGFKGLCMLVDDPSRVYLATTSTKGVMGTRILTYLEDEDAIAGVNASGFPDWAGEGTGGDVFGLCCSQGEFWGQYAKGFASIVLTGSNRLVAGNFSDWSAYDIRDGMQFGPVLIANGVVQVTGSAGYGLQPRTAVGQREDGVIVMLVIDGRNPLYSVGCTVGDMASIMAAYGCVNAGCCDGGSSCVLAYNGQLLNRNSSANPRYGRMMPNAFLVRHKNRSTEDTD